MLRSAVRLLLCLLVAVTAHAATYTVNVAMDGNDGLCEVPNCSLREAVEAVNMYGGGTIAFAIGSGPATINLTSALPDITAPVVIDGTTQPGYAGSPIITINGDGLFHCLTLRASDSTIRGLDLGNCQDGVSVIANNVALSNISFERNFIGTRLGTAPIGRRAISLETAGTGTISGVNIGNATASGRNVLSTYGFVADALYIGGNTTNVTVAGNHFGLADDGTPLLTATRFISDIGIYGAAGSGPFTIGGTTAGARNVFGSGGGTQINLKIDSRHTNLVVEGNYIGTDPTGTIPRRATNYGVWFFGEGEGVIRNNVITAGNSSISRGVTTTGPVVVKGNWINYKADGSGAFPYVPATAVTDFSSTPGYTIGGMGPGEQNVVVNYHTGILVTSPGARVEGNLVGLDHTGSSIVGSGTRGIASSFARTEPGVVIRNNWIGGFVTGIDIGSETKAEVAVNYVGCDATATVARPNSVGIQVSGAAGRAVLNGNIVGGNTSHGILIQTSTMPVSLNGNIIGVSATGTPLPNGGDGVRVASGTGLKSIGSAAGAANTIWFNTGNGVGITGGTATTVLNNLISSNGGFAIDLGANGVDANDAGDADTGANNLQNAPVLTSATILGPVTTIVGTLNSTPGTSFTIDFYANLAPDPSGFGEAETPIARVVVNTDASGNAAFTVNAGPVTPGSYISASATNATTNDTSEMSNDVVASAAVIQFSTSTATVSESGTQVVLTVTRSGGTGATTSVEYVSANGSATSGSDYTAVSGTLSFNPSETSKTITVPIADDSLDETDETFTVTLGNVVGGTLGSPATTTVTITDDDAAPSLGAGDASVVETNAGTTAMTFTVTLSAASGEPVTVDYTTVDGTATSGSDFGARAGTLTFAPGQTSRNVVITVNGDTAAEANETLQLLLSNASGAAIADDTATGTITNDDGDPSIAIADATVIEGSSGSASASLTVTLSNASSSTVTVNWTTTGNTASSGSDFTASGGIVTFAPGVTTQSITVPVLGDAIVEGNESFFVDLTTPSNGTIADPQATVTIVDDDGSPALTISDVAVDEGAGAAMAVVLLVPASAQAVTVDWAAIAASATATADFVATGATLTFAPGETSRTISLTIVDDGVTEPVEEFSVSLTSPVNASIADGNAIVTIIDDDPLPTISAADEGVVEGNSASVDVTLSNASASTVTVAYTTASGTAGGGDYGATGGTLTFAPGELAKTVTIVTTPDTLQEPDETFFLDLSSSTNATITRPRGTVTITDDDGTPALLVGDATVTEGDAGTATASFTVTLAGNAAQTVTVDFATANGTATAGTDFATASGSLVFTPGVTTRTIEVGVLGDSAVEPGETFFVNLSNAVNATLSDNQAIGTINDDDVAAVVPAISIADASVAEGNAGTTSLSFTVALSAPTTNAVTVNYATADGSALAGTDYAAATGTLVFSPGVTSQSVVVAIAGDVAVEGNETLVVNLSGATNASLLDAQATGTILDDDVAAVVPAISVADASATEGDGGTSPMTFSVTLSAPTTNTVTVSYATANGTAVAGADYASTGGTLVFPPGVLTQSIVVALAGDTAVEGNETFALNLSATNASLLDAQATGTILDDDAAAMIPSISIGNATVSEGDAGTTSLRFRVNLSAPTTGTVQVRYETVNGTALAGSDFAAANGTLVFPSGTTTQTLTIVVVGDTLVEGDETLTVRLGDPVGATIGDGTGRGTIVNDDVAVTPVASVADVDTDESDDAARFTVKLSVAAPQPVIVTYTTIDGSARSGSDYLAANGTITFAPGETSRTVDVTVIDDVVAEGDETFVLELSTGARATALIHDDDGGVSAVLVIGGSGAGSNGSFFRTTLQMHNASDDAAAGNLVVRPMGGGEPRTFGYSLAPRETRDLGATIEVGGFVTGDLVVLTGSIPRTSVRVFNDAGEKGRSGFTSTLIPASKAITAGRRAVLIAPEDAAATRFNVGMRSLSGGASLTFTLRRANGAIAALATRELESNVLVQVAAPSLFGQPLQDNDAIEIAVTRGSAIVYGSAVDNVTQDPSFTVAE